MRGLISYGSIMFYVTSLSPKKVKATGPPPNPYPHIPFSPLSISPSLPPPTLASRPLSRPCLFAPEHRQPPPPPRALAAIAVVSLSRRLLSASEFVSPPPSSGQHRHHLLITLTPERRQARLSVVSSSRPSPSFGVNCLLRPLPLQRSRIHQPRATQLQIKSVGGWGPLDLNAPELRHPPPPPSDPRSLVALLCHPGALRAPNPISRWLGTIVTEAIFYGR